MLAQFLTKYFIVRKKRRLKISLIMRSLGNQSNVLQLIFMLSCYSPENLQISIFKFKIFKPKPNLPMFKSTGEDASLMTVVDDIQGDDYDP